MNEGPTGTNTLDGTLAISGQIAHALYIPAVASIQHRNALTQTQGPTLQCGLLWWKFSWVEKQWINYDVCVQWNKIN
jgi:hypothetical protein